MSLETQELEQLKATLKQALPDWLRDDPGLREFLRGLLREDFAERAETQDRFYALLDELRRDREEWNAKWKANQTEQQAKWQEQQAKWQEQQAKWQEQQAQDAAREAKWEAERKEQQAQDAAREAKWEAERKEQQAKWQEQQAKWEANQADIRRLTDALLEQSRKHDRSIGALGARWGLRSEKAFRDALAGILEQNFGVTVLNYCGFDAEGLVFGRPEQIELDVIIKNGLLILAELKSSIDKAGMYSFERKARFYEREQNRKATRLLVISPMIEARARTVAESLGIDCYGDSSEVESLD